MEYIKSFNNRFKPRKGKRIICKDCGSTNFNSAKYEGETCCDDCYSLELVSIHEDNPAWLMFDKFAKLNENYDLSWVWDELKSFFLFLEERKDKDNLIFRRK